jgi:hypothetical protein
MRGRRPTFLGAAAIVLAVASTTVVGLIARGSAPGEPEPPGSEPEPKWSAARRALVPNSGEATTPGSPAPAAPPRPPQIVLESNAPKPVPADETANAKGSKPAEAPKPIPPLPIPVHPDRPTARGQVKDDAVMVGGVAVPIPPAPLPARPVSRPVTTEPPIRLPDAAPGAANPKQAPPLVTVPGVPQLPPDPPAAQLPAIPTPGSNPAPVMIPTPSGPGPIDVGGQPIPFDALARLVDGGDFGPPFGGPGSCPTCGNGMGGIGGCGPGQCRAGAGARCCEAFPATGPLTRFVGLIYQCICCPDPCYQPHWEPIADAAFFTDAPRPVTQTRVRWDYSAHVIFPDRGEFLLPRADGKGKGPKPNPPALGIGYLDYHELSIQAEAAAGPASVTIVTPYRSINPFPFANSAAGFGDVQITSKNILYDCELFIFSFQMRTYIPSGNFGKGLGVGHVSLEPGLISGIRLSPDTYAVAEVVEWIPLGGDQDYQGAHLRFNFSLNHVLWRPVHDVQLIGTLEMNGINWQDGAFTDPVDGPLQKLSGETAVAFGCGARLFFCDKFDFGVGGMFGATGKYWAREQMRFEVRYRF